MQTFYLRAHPSGNCYPKWMPISPQTVARIRTGALGDLSVPREHVVALECLSSHSTSLLLYIVGFTSESWIVFAFVFVRVTLDFRVKVVVTDG